MGIASPERANKLVLELPTPDRFAASAISQGVTRLQRNGTDTLRHSGFPLNM